MNFAHPSYLWLFLLFIPAVVWYIYKHRKAEASLQISSTYAFDRMGNSYKKYLRHLLFLLRLGAVACLIIVLARPQSTNYWRNQATEGIDIVISLDISSSMLARQKMSLRNLSPGVPPIISVWLFLREKVSPFVP